MKKVKQKINCRIIYESKEQEEKVSAKWTEIICDLYFKTKGIKM
jgi:hypothetical protein